MEEKTVDEKQDQKNSLEGYDLTQGTILPKIFQFAWPLILSNIFQQLYNTADSIIVGNYVGELALAAIGVFSPIYNLLIGLFQGVSVGGTVIVSQSFGSKNEDRLNHAIQMALLMTFGLGAVISCVGIFACSPLLKLIGTPDDVFEGAALYSRIMYTGIIPILLYNIVCGILRGMGDSMKPLLFLIVSSVLNVGLDYLFVVVLHYGVSGAAVATVVAQTLAAIAALVYLLASQKKYHLNLKGLKPDWSLCKDLLSIGLPTGIQSVIFNVGFMLQQNLINSFGTTLIAAYSVAVRMDGFANVPANSFSVALTTFVGQNVGAKKLDRAMEGVRKVLIMCQILIILMMAVAWMNLNTIVSWFTSDPEVIATAVNILKILCVGYVVLNPYVLMTGAVRGVGDTMAPLIASFIFNITLRTLTAYVLVWITHDYRGIFVAIADAWLNTSMFMLWYYYKGKWKRKVSNML